MSPRVIGDKVECEMEKPVSFKSPVNFKSIQDLKI